MNIVGGRAAPLCFEKADKNSEEGKGVAFVSLNSVYSRYTKQNHRPVRISVHVKAKS